MPLDWIVHQLRLTQFVATPQNAADEVNYWELFAGEPPDTDENARKLGFRRQVGQFSEGVSLELLVKANRLDWNFQSTVPPTDFGLPTIGHYRALMDPVLGRLDVWFRSTSLAFNRVAFAPAMVARVESRLRGYEELLELVPSLRPGALDDISDLQFQINRPIASAHEGLKINRVMNWSVLQAQFSTIGPLGDSVAKEPRYYCRVGLDMNTAPLEQTDATLDSGQLASIFGEMSERAELVFLRGEMS